MSALPPPPPDSGSTPPPPPGTVPYYPSQARPADAIAGGAFRRVGGLAKAMLILLVIWAAFQVLSLPVLVAVSNKADDYLKGNTSEASFEDAIETQFAVQGLQGGINVALIVLTLIWMFRLAVNHRALGRPGSTWGPGWAIGGWFLPPVIVYAIPWLMFRELWKGSDPENQPDDPAWKQRPVSPLIQVWWVLYGLVPIVGLAVVGSAGFGRADFASEDSQDYADLLHDTFAVQVVLAICALVAAAVYAKIVRDLTNRQKHLTGEI